MAANIVLTPVARLEIFEALNAKTEYDAKTKKSVVSSSDKARYNATLLISKTEDVSAIKAAIKKAAAEKNPAIEFKEWRHKLMDGDKEIEKYQRKNPEKSATAKAHYKGMWVLPVKSVHCPDLSKAVNGKAVEVPSEMVSREFYSGCYVRAEINFAATEITNGEDQDGNPIYNRYVTGYHNFIVKVKDGERLGRKSRDDVFRAVLGGTSEKAVDTDDVEF
jgi:hypothetical protein